MKKFLWAVSILSILLFNGCSNKSSQVTASQVIKGAKIAKDKAKDEKVVVEVDPVIDNKAKVVTKVKPEVDVVAVDKLKKGEIPVVVVDPVEAEAPVKAVEVLPVVDDTVGVVTKVEPTVEIEEEVPVKEGEIPAVVVDPVPAE